MNALYRRTRDSYPIASNRHDRPSGQLLGVVLEDSSHELDSSFGWYIRKANKPAVRRSFHENELAEVLVHGHQDSVFGRSPIQHYAIARVRTTLPGFHDIVSVLAQPLRQPVARAPINEKPHFAATPTESRESWETTACA